MKRLTRRTPISAVVLVCVLLSATLLIGACGSSSGAKGSGGSTTSGGSTAANVTTYTDSTYGYSFQYPEAWKFQKGDTAEVSAGGTAVASVGIFDPKGTSVNDTYIDMAQVSVYKLNQAIDDSLMPQVKTEVESVLSSLESQAPDMKVLEALTETSVNGMSGYKVTYSFSKDGAPCTTTLYFLFSGEMEYQVTTQAGEQNWAADKPIFDALIASFKQGQGK